VRRGARLERTLASIPPFNEGAAGAAGAMLDSKTKPPGSLGRLEELACRVAGALGAVPPEITAAIVVAAADHGVTTRGVSAYPSEVTRQMLSNYADGGAAVCVLARRARARLITVDCGVVDAPPTSKVLTAVVDDVCGTDDLSAGPAMRRRTAVGMIEWGIELADELAADGVHVVAIGEMGIGNTTAASAVVAALTEAAPASVCGPGTGLDTDGVARKVEAVERGLAAAGLPRPRAHAIDVLAAVGGLELAFLVGVTLGAVARRRVVLLDGFVTGAAALLATRLAPSSVERMVAASRSPEPGHPFVLADLGLEPLLDLGLRLGEGTGAALALPLLGAAIALLNEMATFEAAGVSGRARGDGAVLARARSDA
jgi:nicotinate-nucleotide--dimethylbenzimidazole phosphoribosyltransferase